MTWVDQEESLPWEQRLDETTEQYRAFCDYRDMAKASLNALWEYYRSTCADPPTKRLRTLAEWSSNFSWVARRKEWWAFADEIKREAALLATREMGERQARDAVKIQSAAMAILDLLAGYDEMTGEFVLREDAEYRFQDVVRLFKTGVEAERVARGEAATIIEKRRRKTDLSQLSDEELDALADEEDD